MRSLAGVSAGVLRRWRTCQIVQDKWTGWWKKRENSAHKPSLSLWEREEEKHLSPPAEALNLGLILKWRCRLPRKSVAIFTPDRSHPPCSNFSRGEERRPDIFRIFINFYGKMKSRLHFAIDSHLHHLPPRLPPVFCALAHAVHQSRTEGPPPPPPPFSPLLPSST